MNGGESWKELWNWSKKGKELGGGENGSVLARAADFYTQLLPSCASGCIVTLDASFSVFTRAILLISFALAPLGSSFDAWWRAGDESQCPRRNCRIFSFGFAISCGAVHDAFPCISHVVLVFFSFEILLEAWENVPRSTKCGFHHVKRGGIQCFPNCLKLELLEPKPTNQQN